MKKSILIMLSVIAFTAIIMIQPTYAQDNTEPWPGVTKKVLVDNEKVNIAEVTFAPGAVATWHSHPQFTVYAMTEVKMKVEVKDKENSVVELKVGDAFYSPAVTHQTSNIGKKSFTVLVTEIK